MSDILIILKAFLKIAYNFAPVTLFIITVIIIGLIKESRQNRSGNYVYYKER